MPTPTKTKDLYDNREVHLHGRDTVRARGACTGTDPELFFTDSRAARSAALAICARCPVIALCLQEFGDLSYGVVGGMTAKTRTQARNKARAAEAVLS